MTCLKLALVVIILMLNGDLGRICRKLNGDLGMIKIKDPTWSASLRGVLGSVNIIIGQSSISDS